MRIIFLGSGRFAMPTLRWLAESDHTVALVVTQPARPSGRGRRIVRTPVQALADDLGLETIAVQDVNEPESVRGLLARDARIGLAIDFGQKIGPALLDGWPGGCLNLHASLLPKYRGAAPINWAIVNGEERSGCTVFRMVEKMDAGPILTSRWTELKPEETADELHARLAGIGVDAVQATFALFAGGDIPAGTPQNEAEATKAPKLQKKDGFIDFDLPVSRVANHICGMTAWPGARARFRSDDDRFEAVTLIRARRAETPAKPDIPPGTINANRYVAARDGFLEILEIKPSSGRVMGWSDFVNGRHVAEGDMFESLRE
ncbi:MAG: methionyl-tRNA formyltransferase [Planctomycetes bacterium]|nr:methionyl-tRNA formyltransferase [Planctomycetota bacterium]